MLQSVPHLLHAVVLNCRLDVVIYFWAQEEAPSDLILGCGSSGTNPNSQLITAVGPTLSVLSPLQCLYGSTWPDLQDGLGQYGFHNAVKAPAPEHSAIFGSDNVMSLRLIGYKLPLLRLTCNSFSSLGQPVAQQCR